MIKDLAEIAARRRAMVDSTVKGESRILVHGQDISVRDNASLATAAAMIVEAFFQLRQEGFIDEKELLRMTYKFAGEIVDVDALIAAGKKAGKLEVTSPRPSPAGKGGPEARVLPDGDVSVKK
jgi:hypothetical protein